ncbi:MAG: mechanosensitive ion channel domain-containing protein [Candidatus Hodarchaeota archaeon]
MKRVYKIAVWMIFISTIVVIYIFFGFEQLLLNVLILNLVAYVLRSILIDVLQSLIKTLLIRYIIMIIINVIWLLFPFWLIFIISPIYFVAIISFLVVAISLTFQNIINNIASGVMLLSSEGFEAGDLVRINQVDGIVKEITLNNLKLLDFDGSITYIPNKTAFNSSVVRYTHIPIKKETKIEISEVVKKLRKIITHEKKITRYIKVVELLGSVDSEKLETLLNPIFKKYEPIFGTKPYFYANNTVSGIVNRLSITIQIITEDPNLILTYTDPLIKEILYKIYEKEINYGLNVNELDEGKVKNGNF